MYHTSAADRVSHGDPRLKEQTHPSRQHLSGTTYNITYFTLDSQGRIRYLTCMTLNSILPDRTSFFPRPQNLFIILFHPKRGSMRLREYCSAPRVYGANEGGTSLAIHKAVIMTLWSAKNPLDSSHESCIRTKLTREMHHVVTVAQEGRMLFRASGWIAFRIMTYHCQHTSILTFYLLIYEVM